MRRFASRYLRSRHTTDVLSFRMADDAAPPRRARRVGSSHSPPPIDWGMFANLPADKYVGLNNAPSSDNNTLDRPPSPPRPCELGTVVLAPDYCARLARARGVAEGYYALLATVHGLAHLVGHDHDSEKARASMKVAERLAVDAVLCAHYASDGDCNDAGGELPRTYLQ